MIIWFHLQLLQEEFYLHPLSTLSEEAVLWRGSSLEFLWMLMQLFRNCFILGWEILFYSNYMSSEEDLSSWGFALCGSKLIHIGRSSLTLFSFFTANFSYFDYWVLISWKGIQKSYIIRITNDEGMGHSPSFNIC